MTIMHIIGLLGGVASGKSFVAKELARLGAGVLDADEVGHAVLELPAIQSQARQRWGGAIFAPDGQIDRSKLATIVFAPPRMVPESGESSSPLRIPRSAAGLSRRLAAWKGTELRRLCSMRHCSWRQGGIGSATDCCMSMCREASG